MTEEHETWDEILLEKLEDLTGDDLLAALATEIATLTPEHRECLKIAALIRIGERIGERLAR